MAKVLPEVQQAPEGSNKEAEPEKGGAPECPPTRETDRLFRNNRIAKEEMIRLLEALGLSRSDAASILKLTSGAGPNPREGNGTGEGA